MRRSLFFVVVAAVALVASGCDLAFMTPPGAAPLRYRDAIFTSTVKTADITYGSAQNLSNQTVTLTLDEYAPPANDTITSRPAIIWVHGGSFSGGDKTSPEIVDEMTTFAKKGYVNFSINYRLEPGGCNAGGPTPSCLQAIAEAAADAQTAVRFVRSNASTYKVDATRIAIGGSSAGAITAVNVGFGSGEDPSAAVKAVQSLSGAQINAPGAPGPGDAPILLLHGTSDTTVPYQWAVNTRNNAQDAGIYAYLTSWQGAGHVPYAQHHDEIISQTSNFFYWTLDAGHAAQ